MSDEQNFMALPSLVRQAMERAAGFNGVEALTREKPVPVVMVTAADWLIIRDHIVGVQEMLDDMALEARSRDIYID